MAPQGLVKTNHSEVSMGGIKNKSLLNKAINKVPLWLNENVRRQSDKGIVLTKYLGIACLSLAILSTLVLNIISSYSSSKVNSNAEPVSNSNANLSTLANGNDSSICDPTNTNAASCISLSITSSSSSTDSNNPNLSLQIPRGGGIAVGRHTVSVSSNNVTGYYVTLTGNAGSPAMVPSTPTSQAFIQSTTGTLTSPSPLAKGQWGSWGVALPNSSLYPGFNTNEADYNSTNQDTLAKTTWAAVPSKETDDNTKTIIKTTTSSKTTDTYPVYYGVRVDNPVSVPADTYTTEVVYTATTNEVEKPTITSIDPNQYELGSNTNLDSNNRLPITITGTNLESTYNAYLENNADSSKRYDITGENITSVTDTQLKLTLPTDITNSDLEPGEYTIHVVTQGGEDAIRFTYTEKKLPDGILQVTADYGTNGRVAVDYDDNMIPVVYNSTIAMWESITNEETQTEGLWFRYNTAEKRWANAVTVRNPEDYREHKPVEEDDILGFWTYIPRYAYKVMRRDAYNMTTGTSANATVTASNFDIVFETSDDSVKKPIECLSGDYRACVNEIYGQSALLYGEEDGTAWATHPAFTWSDGTEDGTVELNGFWIGKFETTGSADEPTIKPNLMHMSSASGRIGDQYDVAKSIGVEDEDNQYGNTQSTNMPNQNSHNLVVLSSHMAKNSEWGAVAYLSASSFGSGYDQVKLNLGTTTGAGPSGRTYNTRDGVRASTTGNETGVYDMAGGAWEYVMGSYSLYTSSSHQYFSYEARQPYVDIYNISSSISCTWEFCGGDSLHETYRWNGSNPSFVDGSNPWFLRGGYAGNSSISGIFASSGFTGYAPDYCGFRVVLGY